MMDNYTKIVQDNLEQLYSNLPKDLEKKLPGEKKQNGFVFDAFGETCWIEPEGIRIGEKQHASVLGILISLYALNACSDILITEPLKAFKAFPDSMPYAGAFATHTEQLLAPHVGKIKNSVGIITKTLKGKAAPDGIGGDFAFILHPLPKIGLCYIFYEADDEFPAAVTCLYSNNAQLFLPVDGLADVGEYCSKTILKLIE